MKRKIILLSTIALMCMGSLWAISPKHFTRKDHWTAEGNYSEKKMQYKIELFKINPSDAYNITEEEWKETAGDNSMYACRAVGGYSYMQDDVEKVSRYLYSAKAARDEAQAIVILHNVPVSRNASNLSEGTTANDGKFTLKGSTAVFQGKYYFTGYTKPTVQQYLIFVKDKADLEKIKEKFNIFTVLYFSN